MKTGQVTETKTCCEEKVGEKNCQIQENQSLEHETKQQHKTKKILTNLNTEPQNM